MSVERLGFLVLLVGSSYLAVSQSLAFRRQGLTFIGTKRRRRRSRPKFRPVPKDTP